jgi:hypothetical protein
VSLCDSKEAKYLKRGSCIAAAEFICRDDVQAQPLVEKCLPDDPLVNIVFESAEDGSSGHGLRAEAERSVEYLAVSLMNFQ